MIRHTVLLRWNDSVDAEHVAGAAAALDALSATLDGLVDYRHGSDLSLADTNWDYAIVADFVDADAYTTYRDRPDHRELIAEWIADHVTDRAAVQYAID